MRGAVVYLCLVSVSPAWCQRGLFIDGPTACMRVDTSAFVSVDGDFANFNCDPITQVRFNGALYLSGSLANNDSLRFAGSTNSASRRSRLIFRSTPSYTAGHNAVLSGSVTPKLWTVEMDKPGGSVTLQNNVRCWDTIEFRNGSVYMNHHTWELMDPVGAVSVLNHPWIKNEQNTSRFMPLGLSDTGQVVYRTIYTTTLNMNPANIGIELRGVMDYGSQVEFYRGFKAQGNVVRGSVGAHYIIKSPDYALLSNTVVVHYFWTDVNLYSNGFLGMSNLRLFASQNSDNNWSPLSLLQSTIVGGSVTRGNVVSSLSGLSHPNIALDGKLLRLVIGDPNCLGPPISALVLDTLHLCEGDSSVLDAGIISGNNLRYEWNTGPPAYTRTIGVSADSSYQKKVVSITDAKGCRTLDSVIIAPAAPYPQIRYLNHLNACLGDSVTIKDTITISSGSFKNSWLFSDSTSGKFMQNLFRKKFASAGNYHGFLYSVSEHGCASTATISNMIVYPLPTASFTFSHDCVTDAVTFSNTSVSNYSTLVISANQWSLGMGSANTSTLSSPVQTYTSAGNYRVGLITISSFGCRDTTEDTVIIHPRNNASFHKANTCDGSAVGFTNTSTCNTGTCSYSWFLGDGSTSQQVHAQRTYSAAGLYNTKLKVTAPVGCPDSASAVVFVNPLPMAGFQQSHQDLCVNNYVYFTNSSTISAGNIASYYWDFGNGSGSITTNAAVSYSAAGIFTCSLTAFSDSGCVDVSVTTTTVYAQPIASFSTNTVCHENKTHFVSTSSGFGTVEHEWSYGNNITTGPSPVSQVYYRYPQAGTYAASLRVADGHGCSDTGYATVTVLVLPSVNLGGAIGTCETTYTLDAQNAGAYYQWWPGGLQTRTVVVTSSGAYSVAVTGTNGCVSGDAVQVTLHAQVTPQLGKDTTVCGQMVLDAGYPGCSYTWNSSATTQTLLATVSGLYKVTVTDPNQCEGADSILISVLPPATVDLGKDTSLCVSGKGLVLAASGNGSMFGWSGGSSGQSITVYQSGVYDVVVMTANGCKAWDTVVVNFLSTPRVELGADRSACGKLVLDAQNFGCFYAWSGGASTQVMDQTSSGKVYVTVTNSLTGCWHSDSINVVIHPLVNVDLGNDTSLCSNISFVLDAGNENATYRWLDGSMTRTMQVYGVGLYGVTVTSAGGCRASDYINVMIVPAPEVNLGLDSQYVCGQNPLVLYSSYQAGNVWASADGFRSSASVINIVDAGKYWLTVTEGTCQGSDTIEVAISNNTIQAMFLASTQDTVNRPVQFVNLSRPVPVSQTWYFGDGLTSNEFSPVHTFYQPADFSVTLEVSNGFCTDRITKALSVLFRESREPGQDQSMTLNLSNLKIFPNPSSGQFYYYFELSHAARTEITVSDLSGKVVQRSTLPDEVMQAGFISLDELSGGLYVFTIRATHLTGRVEQHLKIIKTQ